MPHFVTRCSRGAAWALTLVLLSLLGTAAAAPAYAQTVNRDDITYILPYWFPFRGASTSGVSNEIADMRARLGPEGPYVRLGFAVYVFVSMDDWNVEVDNPAAVRAALSGTIRQIDSHIAKARAANVPIAFSIITEIRERYDPAQTASEAEDVRSMQWFATNEVARGWWTFSRYARKQQRVQEAYVRELGKVLANRMRLYPDILVASSGDGEQELPFGTGTRQDIYADYSPFTVAEFRDWIRHGGLYAPGEAFDGQGYSLGARYRGDVSPADDTNGDGHTLNGDAGTTFTTWDLLHFNWSLTDAWQTGDSGAIPLSAYTAPGFQRLPGSIQGGFDPPRVPQYGAVSDWWALWVLFKQTLVQRHNIEFAKWITTSTDPETGARVPPERWYSYQIPADYLFNGTPEIPNERWYSSMSSWWTADIAPYGSMAFTAFNVDFGTWEAITLPNVAPRIAERDRRWGIVEWNPGVTYPTSGESTKTALFDAEMAVIERYRPTLLQPWVWDEADFWDPCCGIKDTEFESALRGLIARIKDGLPSDPRISVETPVAGANLAAPFVVSGWAADLGKIRGPGRGPGIDRVDAYAVPVAADGRAVAVGLPAADGARIHLGTAIYGALRADVAGAFGAQFGPSGFSLTVPALPAGRYDLVVSAHSTVTLTETEVNIGTVFVGSPTQSAPVVTTHPASQSVQAGAVASFTAAATGTPAPTLRWQVSTDGGATWTDIPGATAAAYAFTTAQADNGKQFRAVFWNSFGAVATNVAVLTVAEPVPAAPTVVTHPVGLMVRVATEATFGAAATGTPTPSVQWQVSADAGTTWTAAPGATGTAYTFTATVAHDGMRVRAVFTNASGSAASNPATLRVYGPVRAQPTSLRFTGTEGTAARALQFSPAQVVTVSFTGAPSAWTATTEEPWIQVTGGSGVAGGVFSVGIVNPGDAIGSRTSLSGSVTISAPDSANGTVSVPVTLAIDRGTPEAAPPFGLVDTPAQEVAGVVGAIGITGWALDDTGVAWVRLFRNCLDFEPAANCSSVDGLQVVYLGEATIVPGARPDIEAQYPTYPDSPRAGWGYSMLTNLAPDVLNRQMSGGVGPLTVYVRAGDVAGNEAWLGRDFLPGSQTLTDGVPTTIAMANDTIDRPFGTIDTPAQGQTVSGRMWNFGWSLTPDRDSMAGPDDILMPSSGSTITVWIDGAPVGTVLYNLCRGQAVNGAIGAGQFCDDDISSLFGNAVPQPLFTPRGSNPTVYRNLDAGRGAIGAFLLDTATLADGLHTIVWSAEDSAGRGEGLGSRYFGVLKTGTGDQPTSPDALPRGFVEPGGPGISSVTKTGTGDQPTSPDALPRGFVEPGGPGASSVAVSRRDTPDPRSPVPGPGHEAGVFARTGFSLDAPLVELTPDADGVRHVRLGDIDRLELRFAGSSFDSLRSLRTGKDPASMFGAVAAGSEDPASRNPASIDSVASGYLVVNGELRPLPAGSQFDPEAGRFTWAPGAGFVGTYRLAFGVHDEASFPRTREPSQPLVVDVTIRRSALR